MDGSRLKLIAVVTMLLDHVAYGILFRMPSFGGGSPIYIMMRCIGRMAFPIYIFLLIEGFKYTKSRLKYALRMLVFCFVSEIPFDLAFNGGYISMRYQNVFFTLLIGFLTIWAMDAIWHKLFKENKEAIIPTVILDIIVVGAGCFVAYYLKTDYRYAGVLAIVVMYILRSQRVLQILFGILALVLFSSVSEIFAVFIIPCILAYNGKRGIGLKYLFYAFYPVHLLFIYVIAVLIGVNSWFI